MSDDLEIFFQEVTCEADTIMAAQKIFTLLQPGEVILLIGELGMGKTFLARELLRLWGVQEPITSPTFTLIHEFEVENRRFIHADLYRIHGEKELEDLDIMETLTASGAVLIEWGERFPSIRKRATVEITLKPISKINAQVNDEVSEEGRVIQASRKTGKRQPGDHPNR